MKVYLGILITFVIAILLSIYLYLTNLQNSIYQNLITDIDFIRNASIKNSKPINGPCTKLMGYMIKINSETSYSLIELCSEGDYNFKTEELSPFFKINSNFPTTTFRTTGNLNIFDVNKIKLFSWIPLISEKNITISPSGSLE